MDVSAGTIAHYIFALAIIGTAFLKLLCSLYYAAVIMLKTEGIYCCCCFRQICS